MIITAIEPRRKALSAVYIDGEFALKLDTMTLAENRINIGAKLDDNELKELIEKSDARRAKEKALWLISYRDHSKKELQDKIKKTTSSEAAETAIERMEELGLINDETFARRYADELLQRKHMAPKGIVYKLREKGIDSKLIDIIIEEIEYDYVGEIAQLLQRKYPNAAEDEKSRRRATAFLQRLGYSWDEIKKAISQIES
ncbi:regulatory protein RecX [Clostridia bacterium]|nr:regulatory protein RecX [Clostridia bacterium]